MSRTLGSLATHLSGTAHTRAKMLRLDLNDGTSLGFTDHDQALAFDLGDGAISYSPDTGILPSNLVLTVGFDADNYEVTGPLGDDVTADAVLGGRFNRARARLFLVNWSSLGSGAAKLMQGYISEVRVEGGKFVFQIRSEVDYLNQTIGRLIAPYCSHDFGDARCQAVPVEITGTVSAVASDFSFTVTFSGSYANGFFNLGTVQALTGALAGTAPVEIVSWTSGGTITLFVPLADSPEIGDTFNIRQGCDKTRATCRDTFDNVINFGGFPEVPGSDQVLKYPVPTDA